MGPYGIYRRVRRIQLRGLLGLLQNDSEVSSALSEKSRVIAPTSSYPFLLAMKASTAPLLVVTSSSRGAEDLADELKALHNDVFEFPAWETLPHERLSPRRDS